MSDLVQLWGQEEFRRSLVAALRGWNSALTCGWPEQLRAAGLLKQIFVRYDSHSTADHAPTTRDHTPPHAPSRETPAQTLDRLLDFPSHRLAVYGSLAPGKKNHHVIAGINGSWRTATLRGSLLNKGWGAGEGFPGYLWDGTNTPIAAQVFTSADLPHYWNMLDEFEGEEYRRILAPLEVDDGSRNAAQIAVCNVYALAKGA